MPERKKLLQVKHLKQYFTSGKSTVKAVAESKDEDSAE